MKLNHPDPIAIPPALLAELAAEAADEHRPPMDVLQDAVTRYVRQKRWQKIYAYGEAQAKALGLTEDDIPRLIAERLPRRDRQVMELNDFTDGDIAALEAARAPESSKAFDHEINS